MALPTQSNKAATPVLPTKTSSGGPMTAPSVNLVVSSTTQVPQFIEHANVWNTAGEEPVYLVRMRDGTYAYLKESAITSSGGTKVI